MKPMSDERRAEIEARIDSCASWRSAWSDDMKMLDEALAESAYWKNAVRNEWRPIETAPLGEYVLFWWRPIHDNNPYAESCVIGQISTHELGKWWNGQTGTYQDVWHLTHWMPLPKSPRLAQPKGE